MQEKKYTAIGLMSGSSLDGLDIACCHFFIKKNEQGVELKKWNIIAIETIPFSEKWTTRLLHLSEQSALILAQTNTYFSYYIGDLLNIFLKKYSIKPDFIATHGHTVYHTPSKRMTFQLGNGGALAATTGYTTISDFRTQDVTINGEGAPIVPIADKWLFNGYDFYLNIGGIANISANVSGKYLAFDISEANQILNALAGELDLEYDQDGKIASEGEVDENLLEELNKPDFLNASYPKSLSNQWVVQHLIRPCLISTIPIKNRLRTACEHLAVQLNKSLNQVIERESFQKEKYTILATGGGVHNLFLIKCIKNHLSKKGQFEVIIPSKEVIDFKEAIMIALMGMLRLENTPNCISSATGATRDSVAGAVYL